jgi:hypothetical protein
LKIDKVQVLNELELMTKRLQITLPDSVADDLKLWASDQRRPVANLVAYLLEKAIDDAKQRGDFPTP